MRQKTPASQPALEDNEKVKEDEEEDKGGKTPPLVRRPAQSSNAKTVTFNTAAADYENNYAEQTPLMFSRSSSLESLDSLEQQQVHDEGSVVSEFSRLTSRAVSPSELPDSPGQTMPSSPRRPPPAPSQAHPQQQQQIRKPLLPPRQPEQPQGEGVFEDATNNFGQEGTPAFTRAASPLSQLSFDDEPPSALPIAPLPAPSVPSRPPMPLPPSARPLPNVAASAQVGHSAQQIKPVHPVHSTHPSHASHPSLPVHPSHPIHPSNPSHSSHPAPPVHSAHPVHPSHSAHPSHPAHLIHPVFSRVVKSASEVNFRSVFEYDEVSPFPNLTVFCFVWLKP